MEGYDATTYGERWADVYDDWYADPDEVDATCRFLSRLAGAPGSAGIIVELGVGTGRLALPLAAAGHDVRGVDASPAMVAQLRAKPGGRELRVAVADMGAVPVPGVEGPAVGACGGVFVAYNTFFGLPTEGAQRACLRRVHDVLAPGGWFVVAAFVPAPPPDPEHPASSVGVRTMAADRVVLTADVHDPQAQTVSGQFIDITDEGTRLRPFHIHYLFPHQLDALASDAGLHLAERWSSWDGAPFDDDSTMHVSVYRS